MHFIVSVSGKLLISSDIKARFFQKTKLLANVVCIVVFQKVKFYQIPIGFQIHSKMRLFNVYISQLQHIIAQLYVGKLIIYIPWPFPPVLGGS